MFRRIVVISACILCGICCSTAIGQDQPTEKGAKTVAASQAAYLKLAEETEAMLRRDVLGVWFPRTADKENGGFRSNFNREWKPYGKESKFSVFQGRMTWISGQIAARRPDLRAEY